MGEGKLNNLLSSPSVEVENYDIFWVFLPRKLCELCLKLKSRGKRLRLASAERVDTHHRTLHKKIDYHPKS